MNHSDWHEQMRDEHTIVFPRKGLGIYFRKPKDWIHVEIDHEEKKRRQKEVLSQMESLGLTQEKYIESNEKSISPVPGLRESLESKSPDIKLEESYFADPKQFPNGKYSIYLSTANSIEFSFARGEFPNSSYAVKAANIYSKKNIPYVSCDDFFEDEGIKAFHITGRDAVHPQIVDRPKLFNRIYVVAGKYGMLTISLFSEHPDLSAFKKVEEAALSCRFSPSFLFADT